VLGGVNGLKAFQNVVKGVVARVFPRLHGQALMAHILQGHHLGADFLLGKLAARNLAVLRMIGAVQATVHAVVGKIQGREQHHPIAVVGLLDIASELTYLGVHRIIVARHG
jgi:hypothetical protein